MATLFGMFPFLKTLFADGGYQGPQFANALANVLPHLDVAHHPGRPKQRGRAASEFEACTKERHRRNADGP
jgi:hypothetical protein